MKKSNLELCFESLADGKNDPRALATIIQVAPPTSSKVGDKALINKSGIVEGWVGGGCVQSAIVNATNTVIESQKPLLILVAPKGEWHAVDGISQFTSACPSGGSLLIFIEPIKKRLKLCVLGHSPVAMKLASLASQLSFQVSIMSPDLDLNSLPSGVVGHTDFVDIDATFCMIATQGKGDKAALKAALDSTVSYLGMIASAKKAKALKVELISDGLAQAEVDRIDSPVGKKLGGETPAEIALAALSELVSRRNSGLYDRVSAHDGQVIDG